MEDTQFPQPEIKQIVAVERADGSTRVLGVDEQGLVWDFVKEKSEWFPFGDNQERYKQ